LNKNVFNDRLKVEEHLVALSSQGNLFQIRGTATANALSPNFSFVLGTT
jgi:hypothetical protein